MFFGGLFTAYLIYRNWYYPAFVVGSHQLSVVWGTLNTAVLIISSFTMAMGVWCAETRRRRGLVLCLTLTFILGLCFLGIKGIEWTEKAEKHHVPGFHYSLNSFIDPASDPRYKEYHDKPLPLDMARHTEIYFSLYFAHDRHARAAHGHWRQHSGIHDLARPGRGLHGGPCHVCGELRPLLALCGHHLDLSLRAALSDQQTSMKDTNGMSEQTKQSEHEHHIVSPRVYVAILLRAAGGYRAHGLGVVLELGLWNPVIALAIATAKATLVVLFFMHVKYSTKLTKLTVGAAVFMFLTLISMTLADYISRAWGSW